MNEQYAIDNFDRVVAQYNALKERMALQAARHARKVAELELQLLEQEERQRWHQRKSVRQARALAKLQEKRAGS